MTFSDFFDRLGNLDWLAVVVGAVVFMVLGAIWYGPLFGKAWSKATGEPAMSMTKMPPTPQFVGGLIVAFLAAAAVNYFGALDDVEHSLVLALLLGVWVIGSFAYSHVVWEKRKLNLFLIEVAFSFVAIAVVSYVEGLMA